MSRTGSDDRYLQHTFLYMTRYINFPHYCTLKLHHQSVLYWKSISSLFEIERQLLEHVQVIRIIWVLLIIAVFENKENECYNFLNMICFYKSSYVIYWLKLLVFFWKCCFCPKHDFGILKDWLKSKLWEQKYFKYVFHIVHRTFWLLESFRSTSKAIRQGFQAF